MLEGEDIFRRVRSRIEEDTVGTSNLGTSTTQVGGCMVLVVYGRCIAGRVLPVDSQGCCTDV